MELFGTLGGPNKPGTWVAPRATGHRTRPARLLLVGRPGSGKGTQAEILRRRLGTVHIATGDLFREVAASDRPIAAAVRAAINSGLLVPDDLAVATVIDRLHDDDIVERGFILDGYPRTVPQAQSLLDLLGEDGIDVAIELHVTDDEARRRLAHRGLVDDGAAGPRVDDDPDTIERRLAVYSEQTEPMLDWLDSRGLLVRVNGMAPPTEVRADIVAALAARLDGLPSPELLEL